MKLLFLLSLFSFVSCSIVGPGEQGMRYSLGKLSDEVLPSGAYIWVPFLYSVQKVTLQIQKTEIKTSTGSKDMQEITSGVAINWSLDPKQVAQTVRTIGDEEAVLDKIIGPAVNEVLKATTAKFAAEEALTRRLEMKEDIDKSLRSRLLKYGVICHDVSIVSLHFSKDFTDAIESKQIAEQQAKQAEYVTQKATQTALAAVETAKGQAQAQQLVRATLTAEMLQRIALEKWDGHFPQVMGTGALPFLNLSLK